MNRIIYSCNVNETYRGRANLQLNTTHKIQHNVDTASKPYLIFYVSMMFK